MDISFINIPKSPHNQLSKGSVSSESGKMDQIQKGEGTLDEQTTFKLASSYMASNTKLKLTNEQQLRIYGLYKQAQIGDVNTPKPGIINMVGRAKWEAWKQNQGMPSSQAMEVYISLVTGLCPGWLDVVRDASCKTVDDDSDEEKSRERSRTGGSSMAPVVSTLMDGEGDYHQKPWKNSHIWRLPVNTQSLDLVDADIISDGS